jgi:hypothetical protein
LRQFFIWVVGMSTVYALLRAATWGTISLMAGIASALVLAALIVSLGSYKLPFVYPQSLAKGGAYFLVALGLTFSAYLEWIILDQGDSSATAFILLFLSAAFTLYAAPSAESFRGVASIGIGLFGIGALLYINWLIKPPPPGFPLSLVVPIRQDQAYGLFFFGSLVAMFGLAAIKSQSPTRARDAGSGTTI